MLEAFSTPRNKNRTFILLGISAVLVAAAAIVGISDNPAGLIMAYLSATSLVVAFVHPWSASQAVPAPSLRVGPGVRRVWGSSQCVLCPRCSGRWIRPRRGRARNCWRCRLYRRDSAVPSRFSCRCRWRSCDVHAEGAFAPGGPWNGRLTEAACKTQAKAELSASLFGSRFQARNPRRLAPQSSRRTTRGTGRVAYAPGTRHSGFVSSSDEPEPKQARY